MISQRFFFNAQRANGGQRVNRALNILENPQMKILEVACGEAAEKKEAMCCQTDNTKCLGEVHRETTKRNEKRLKVQ